MSRYCKHGIDPMHCAADECQPPAKGKAQGPLGAAACWALPTAAGFYWWRVSAAEDWRMVQIVDFAADLPDEPTHLAAYDVEKHAWGGRTLRMWAIHDPIGEWVQCHKPNNKDG
jgi:hypothetical protein